MRKSMILDGSNFFLYRVVNGTVICGCAAGKEFTDGLEVTKCLHLLMRKGFYVTL